MNDVALGFITEARAYLSDDYLPKIERCLERLSDADIWWRAGDQSNSIANLLLHLEGNARQWIISGVGGGRDARVRQQEFAERAPLTRAALVDKLKKTLAEIDGVLARVESSTLLERRLIQGHDVTVLAAIFHVVEHFSTHTGQIILLTKMLTGSDLVFYDFSSGRPRANWR